MRPAVPLTLSPAPLCLFEPSYKHYMIAEINIQHLFMLTKRTKFVYLYDGLNQHITLLWWMKSTCQTRAESPKRRRPPSRTPSGVWAATFARRACAGSCASRTWRIASALRAFTVADIEKGKAGASIAAYVGALWALGLLEGMSDLADPDRDEEGKTLESARSPKTAPRRRRLDNDF